MLNANTMPFHIKALCITDFAIHRVVPVEGVVCDDFLLRRRNNCIFTKHLNMAFSIEA